MRVQINVLVVIVTVFYFLFPDESVCHVAAVLRAKSGADKPLPLFADRVSSQYKVPSLQHKMMQFYDDGRPMERSLAKLRTNRYTLSIPFPSYPVASRMGKGDFRKLIEDTVTPYLEKDPDGNAQTFSIDWEPRIFPENDEPSSGYSPYIGTQSLTNMPTFFEHLRENLKSLARNEGGLNGLGGASIESAASELSPSFALENGPAQRQKRQFRMGPEQDAKGNWRFLFSKQKKECPMAKLFISRQQCGATGI